jgi:hypothetical protein
MDRQKVYAWLFRADPYLTVVDDQGACAFVFSKVDFGAM